MLKVVSNGVIVGLQGIQIWGPYEGNMGLLWTSPLLVTPDVPEQRTSHGPNSLSDD